MVNVEELLSLVEKDPEQVKTLSEEDIKRLRVHIANKTYGVIPESSQDKRYTAISITNLDDKFQKQLLVTGLTSFLYRMAEEYRPEMNPTPSADREEFLAELTYEQNAHAKHIALKENYEKEAQRISAEIKALQETKPVNAHMLGKANEDLSQAISNIKKMEILVAGAKKKINDVLHRNARSHIHDFVEYYFQYDPEIHVRSGTDNRFAISEKVPDVPQHVLRDPVKPLTIERKGDLCLPNPPKELFLSFNTYLTTNYDSLYATTYQLYHEKPALEFIATIFKSNMTEKEKDEFKDKNSDTLPVQVMYLEEKQRCYLGPFSKNRACLEYYNEHTALLQAIYEKMEQDEKAGEDMLKRRRDIEKKQSIAEVGPDDPNFTKWKESGNKDAVVYVTKEGEILEEREVQHLPIHVTDSKTGFKTREIQLKAEAPEKDSATGYKSTGKGGMSRVVDTRKPLELPAAAAKK